MIRIKNVLCPIDFFPASEHALEYSIGIAKNYEATLHILHVVSPVLPTSYEFSLNIADLVATFKKEADERIEKYEATAKSNGVDVETAVRVGEIDTELQTSIDETQADLVVMNLPIAVVSTSPFPSLPGATLTNLPQASRSVQQA